MERNSFSAISLLVIPFTTQIHNLLFTLAQILLTVLLFFGLDILQKIDFIGQCLQIIENRKRRIVFTEQRSIDKRTDQRYYPDSFAGSLFTETRHIKKSPKVGLTTSMSGNAYADNH